MLIHLIALLYCKLCQKTNIAKRCFVVKLVTSLQIQQKTTFATEVDVCDMIQ